MFEYVVRFARPAEDGEEYLEFHTWAQWPDDVDATARAWMAEGRLPPGYEYRECWIVL